MRFRYICLNLLFCLQPTCARNVLLIVGDDAGFESTVYGNTIIHTPSLQRLSDRGVTFTQAFTMVSSCSSSRSVILTGLPPHQNGMYGLHHDLHHFNSFDGVQSLPNILRRANFCTGVIGKKHVGPSATYKFDFEQTEENNPTNLVGRNITHIRLLAEKFLDLCAKKNQDFLLYIAFHDPHRCHGNDGFGGFCERYGNGQPGMGNIPDWTPMYYDPAEAIVPYFVPDTPAARRDIAAQYTAVNRMDQGIGLIHELLQNRSLLNDTLILYTSDNGIPFPSGRTNLYDPGMREPMIMVSPDHSHLSGTRSDRMVSLVDVVPTILDSLGVPCPKYHIFKHDRRVRLHGISLLKTLTTYNAESRRRRKRGARIIFGEHNLHEISMYYPIRVARSRRYKLIKNLNFRSPFPIDQDFYISLTYQDILNRTIHHRPTKWYKNITGYYYRPEFELFDVRNDPDESVNLANKSPKIFKFLQKKLHKWMNMTSDPWLCAPESVVEYTHVKHQRHRFAQCLPLYN